MSGTGNAGRRKPSLIGRSLLGVALALGLQACSASTPLSNKSLGLGYPGIALSEFKGKTPGDYPVHGIDVSKYQGDIDWQTVARSGIEFAYLKATEGGDQLDTRFLENWREAKSAGVPRGAYHFWYHCRPGTEQADWFIRNVPKDPGALPPVIDVEWTPFSPTCTKRPPRDELIRDVLSMADKLEAHYGQRPVLYIPIDVHRERWVDATNSHEIWARAVRDHPDNVYERRKFRFWQYTETGSVPGIRGGVDKNAFAGTRADWNKWLSHHRHG
ncbi:GH25 family lysozyme [Fulvimarina sp. 2208YS6-2-32]|uniref:GH25 family lysozyme n=1 Tax=Fulvimarina uroteuthidis TaxID=3098149 RepID=A0ABU5I760_9HYPH|nr:GH25 family lysozyme [Fulvimarina sp. 2208YS6-2-32]MDY8110748.1 GH25 family lysozyme [Fulvimarina sp. 2208YS6-2-32]